MIVSLQEQTNERVQMETKGRTLSGLHERAR